MKIDGNWLVDDLDDVDDGLPPFSQPSIPDTPDGQAPSTEPPSTEPPSTDPTEGGTEEGQG